MEIARLDGETRLFGIVGHPIVQVRSPQVMTAWLQRAQRNAILIPLHVLPDRFESAMTELMALGNLDGLIMTVPYKVRALALADVRQKAAEHVGAVNALRRGPDGRWCGGIFDGVGMVRAVKADGFDPQGRSVKMIGAGGAGSAVAMALADAGVARLEICDRDAERATALALRVVRYYPECDAHAVRDATNLAGHDLLVNCTPVGMQPGEGMPALFGPLPPDLRVMDVIMKPDVTPLASHARACGCRVLNGIPMLDQQAQAVMSFLTGEAA